MQTLKKLSDYFGISIEELVHGKQERREITFSSSAYTDAELDQIKQFAHFLIRQRERNE